MPTTAKTTTPPKLRKLDTFNAQHILGTPFPVFLHDAVEEKFDPATNEVLSHRIPAVGELSAVVAVMRVMNDQKLNGKEIKFLRKSLSKKACDFAADIGITPEQLSRYENEKQPIPLIFERVLRMSVCLGHFQTAYVMNLEVKRLSDMKIASVHAVGSGFEVHLSLDSKPSPQSIGPNTPRPDSLGMNYKVA